MHFHKIQIHNESVRRFMHENNIYINNDIFTISFFFLLVQEIWTLNDTKGETNTQ